MNQKVKKIFATALCCSLLTSSLNGISVVAETMPKPEKQVENQPRAVPSEGVGEQKAPSYVEADTEAGVPPTDEVPSEQTEQVVGQVEEPVNRPMIANESESLRVQRAVKAVDIPEKTYTMSFLDESGRFIDPAKVSITGDIMKYTMQGALTKVGALATNNVETMKQMTVPKVTLSSDTAASSYEASGIQNEKITLPRFYDVPKVTPSANYTGQVYPMAVTKQLDLTTGAVSKEETTGARVNMFESGIPNQFVFSHTYWINDPAKNLFTPGFNMAVAGGILAYMTTDDHIYYYVPNKRVNIYYNDMNLNSLPAYPTGYNPTLSKTVIDSENFHYKAPKAFPEFYSSGNRYFQFKGWYKGASRPADPKAVKLETSLTPEFDVTYDGADRLYVFYDEVQEMTATFPEVKYNFGLVTEQGTLISPTNVEIQTNLTTVMSDTAQNVGTATGVNVGNLKQLTVPSQKLTYVPKIKPAFAGATNFRLTVPKHYKIPTITPGPFYTGSTTAYPMAPTALRYVSGSADERIETEGSRYRLYPTTTPHSYRMFEGYWTNDITKTEFGEALSMATTDAYPVYYTTDNTMYYYLENRRITERYVDDSGTEITPPTGFTQGNQLVMDSESYTYTTAKALPRTYQVGTKTYVFQGWFKGKNKPATLKTTTTPSFTPTFDDEDDMTAVYQEAVPTAELTLKGSVDIVDNGATMDHWEVMLKNTGEAPLTTIKIKPTAAWAAGISTPNTIFVLGTGQNAKAYPVTQEQWETGFSLPLNTPLPAGGQLQMNLLGTTVTGNPGQVLTAEVEVTGNFGSLTAKDTVRIKDLDQEVTNPDGDGFISTPTFDFGKLAISGSKQQYGLKKAASYYGNGTRNPYLRLNTSQDNWSLTAQLSQPKSATDSLPTTTRLLLGTATAANFTDYNQSTETSTPLGKTSTMTLTADNTATSVVANQQFTGSDVCQLDFTFANIKLEVPANQGMAGQQYQAAVTWNLVTGP